MLLWKYQNIPAFRRFAGGTWEVFLTAVLGFLLGGAASALLADPAPFVLRLLTGALQAQIRAIRTACGCTITFRSTAKILAKCKLEYCRISECADSACAKSPSQTQADGAIPASLHAHAKISPATHTHLELPADRSNMISSAVDCICSDLHRNPADVCHIPMITTTNSSPSIHHHSMSARQISSPCRRHDLEASITMQG